MSEKKRVMIIDDEKDLCDILKMNLEHTGKFEVFTESDSSKAIECIKSVRPDIIFLDVIMPKQGGYAIITALEADEDLKTIPVVFLTATITKDEESFCGGLLTEYPMLAKPVTTKELLGAIEENIKK